MQWLVVKLMSGRTCQQTFSQWCWMMFKDSNNDCILKVNDTIYRSVSWGVARSNSNSVWFVANSSPYNDWSPSNLRFLRTLEYWKVGLKILFRKFNQMYYYVYDSEPCWSLAWKLFVVAKYCCKTGPQKPSKEFNWTYTFLAEPSCSWRRDETKIPRSSGNFPRRCTKSGNHKPHGAMFRYVSGSLQPYGHMVWFRVSQWKIRRSSDNLLYTSSTIQQRKHGERSGTNPKCTQQWQ